MRYPKPIIIIAAGILWCSGAAHADVGDQLAKLLPHDGGNYTRFGHSVGIDGNRAVIGAPGQIDNGEYSGAVYLYDVASGMEIMKLLPDDGAANDWFGVSVAISGNVVIVGAHLNDDTATDSGSAYLFDVTTGEQIAKLLPDDGGAAHWFGYSVGISGKVAIIGAFQDNDNGDYSGSAYLFNVETGQQLAKLIANDGEDEDFFGFAVGISGNTAVVGAVGADDNGNFSGSAYLFNVTTGEQMAKLLPNDGTATDMFGYSVGVDGNTAIVGALNKDGYFRDIGAAYLFDTTTGEQTAKLVPVDGRENNCFGTSVAVSGERAIVGAVKVRYPFKYAKAYLFDTATGDPIISMGPDDAAYFNYFGHSVGISGPIAVSGAFADRENGFTSGAAYLFQVDAFRDCLELKVQNLVGGKRALITISSGTPGANGVAVFGFESGRTVISGYADYCATFGISGINLNKVVGGGSQSFDANGEITLTMQIPRFLSGSVMYFQAAERGTCPDECVSDRFEGIVE